MSLVEKAKRKYYFAGRLDKNSRGLVVLSNDGELIYQLTHPSFKVEKVYQIHVRPPLDKRSIEKALQGVYDKKDLLKFDVFTQLKDQGHYQVTLHQGRNQEIRRMIKRLGRNVIDLQRIKIGKFCLDDLPEGKSKLLDSSSVQKKQKHLI